LAAQGELDPSTVKQTQKRRPEADQHCSALNWMLNTNDLRSPPSTDGLMRMMYLGRWDGKADLHGIALRFKINAGTVQTHRCQAPAK
jgi:hypothetical protein